MILYRLPLSSRHTLPFACTAYRVESEYLEDDDNLAMIVREAYRSLRRDGWSVWSARQAMVMLVASSAMRCSPSPFAPASAVPAAVTTSPHPCGGGGLVAGHVTFPPTTVAHAVSSGDVAGSVDAVVTS